MSRLTKKEPNNLSCHHFRRCEYLRNGTPRVETLNKLGKLEDLMEKYNINNIKKLEEIIEKGLSIDIFLKTNWQRGERDGKED